MRRTLSMLAGTAILAATLVVGMGAPATAAQTPTEAACNGDSLVTKTLESGATWQMCWRVDAYKGLVVEKVAYQAKTESTPIVVLDSLAIAQLNVPYDTGYNQWNDITSYGFGGRFGLKMMPEQCDSNDIRSTYLNETRPDTDVLCVTEDKAGLAYNSKESTWGGNPDDGMLYTAQSTDLVLTYSAKVDWYEYQTEFRFADDGEIDVRLGATGDLAPDDYVDGQQPALTKYGITAEDSANYGWPIGVDSTDYAVSHYHSAIYRVDFGIGGGGDQQVQQFDTDFTGATGRRADLLSTEVTPITTEGKFNKDTRRAWRVLNPESLNADGHARSYEIIPSAGSIYGANPETDYDVAFTQLKADELYASHNLIPSKADAGVPQYLDGETLTDPVAWVNVGFHHIVRDEDQSPMPIHWQGFTLYPRDFTAQSPVIPEGREAVNGNVGSIPTTPTTPPTTPTEPTTPTTPTEPATPTEPGTGTPTEAPVDGGETDGPSVSVSADSVLPGESITVTGSGFEGGESVFGTMYSDPVDLGEHVVDSFGNVTFGFTVPLDATEGSHRVELVSDSGVTVSASFLVDRADVPSVVLGQLGKTGTAAGLLVTLAAVLLIAGGGLAAAAAVRRRGVGRLA